MVSFAALTPDQRMNAATAVPHQPSTGTFQNRPASPPSSTAAVARQSLRLSMAAADMALEEICRPMERL